MARPRKPCMIGFPAGNGECCCNCRYRINDYSHPYTDGKSITIQRGYVCCPPDLTGCFSGWTEHGMCEMWDERPITYDELMRVTENVPEPGEFEEDEPQGG